MDVRTIGTLPASGPITLTDTLAAGLTGWSWCAAEQTVTCGNSGMLEAGVSSNLTLAAALAAAAAPETHTVSVAAAGNLASNNTASDTTDIMIPAAKLQFGLGCRRCSGPTRSRVSRDAYTMRLTGKDQHGLARSREELRAFAWTCSADIPE